ncbi:MAG: hypothetical protein HDT26_13540 [Subdoligranulum sp.]|nr:hypothetical protein [Subdoligranulum sp.]
MKQLFLKSIASLCALCMLAGCAAPAPSPGAGGGAGANVSAGETDPATEMSEAGQTTSDTLHLVTDSQRGSDVSKGNENGYYYIDRGGDITANLRYIDYSTAQDIYLSARPESDHLTPDDESYLSSVAGTGRVFPAGDKLFLLRAGAPSAADTFGDDAMAAVFRMDPDGSNRTLLYQGGADERFGDTAAADGHFLYLIGQRTETTGDAPVEKSYLLRMDGESGQTETLCELADGAWFIGAADGMLIFHSISDIADDDSTPPMFGHKIFAYDVASGTLSVLQTWQYEEYTEAWVYDDLLVTASWTSRTVTLRRLREAEAFAAYPFANDIPADHINFWFAGCTDGRFYFYVDTALRTLDLATGEWGKMTLQYDDPEKMEPRPVQIYAETATQYLVLCDQQMTTRRYVNWDDHSVYALEALQPVFSLIAKEDYWNSVPNYRPVTFNE